MNNIVDKINKTTRDWYLPMIIGIVLVLFGIYLMNVPVAAYTLMVKVFSLSFALWGLAEIIFYSSIRQKLQHAGWHILGAVTVLAVGIYLMFNPFTTAFIIALYVAFALLLKSIQGLIISFQMKAAQAGNWYVLLIMSIVGILISLLLAAQPMIVGVSLVLLVGMSFIFAGIIGIAFSLVLKRLNGLGRNRLKDEGASAETDYELIED